MKHCPKCKRDLPLDAFSFSRNRRDGLSCWCKECSRECTRRYRATPEGAEKHRLQERQRYADNPEPIKRRSAQWTADNIDRARKRNASGEKRRNICPIYRVWQTVRQARWYRSNPAKGVAKTRRRQAAISKATPTWLTAIHNAQIVEAYEISVAISMQTGIPYHVDHIHSLNGPNFVGLHVPWNLRVIPAAENCSKGNKPPDEDAHLMWEAT